MAGPLLECNRQDRMTFQLNFLLFLGVRDFLLESHEWL